MAPTTLDADLCSFDEIFAELWVYLIIYAIDLDLEVSNCLSIDTRFQKTPKKEVIWHQIARSRLQSSRDTLYIISKIYDDCRG